MSETTTYTTPPQPCKEFAPAEDVYGYGMSVHQCPDCDGRRVFCRNCRRDHHAGGWAHCCRTYHKHGEPA